MMKRAKTGTGAATTDRLRRLWQTDHCTAYVRWNPLRAQSPMHRLHRAAGRGHFTDYDRRLYTAARALHLITWPARAAALTAHTNRRFGPSVAERTGKSRLRQALEQYWLAVAAFVPPVAYYRFGLYDAGRRRKAHGYLHNHERKGLARRVNDAGSTETLADKQRFVERCARRGIPVVPILAVVDGVGHRPTLTGNDLFVKPVRGLRGEGAMRFVRNGADEFTSHDGHVLTEKELIEYLRRKSERHPLIVQPTKANHADTAGLSTGALATLRILTARRPDGRVELIAAVFKMPWRRGITSTLGLAGAVDLSSGRLGRAYPYRPCHPGFSEHPATGESIAGRRLPHWGQAVDLARRAHEEFSGCVAVGWDVALTDEGPLLLEGNPGWDVVVMQQPHGRPLGDTPLVAIWLAHLDAGEHAGRISM